MAGAIPAHDSPFRGGVNTSVTLDATQRASLLSTVSDFAQREIAPRVAEYDRAEKLPLDLLKQMADLGFFGGVIPPHLGGLGLDYVTFAQVIEEVSRTCHVMGGAAGAPPG